VVAWPAADVAVARTWTALPTVATSTTAASVDLLPIEAVDDAAELRALPREVRRSPG
jgi:hypothetical protein